MSQAVPVLSLAFGELQVPWATPGSGGPIGQARLALCFFSNQGRHLHVGPSNKEVARCSLASREDQMDAWRVTGFPDCRRKDGRAKSPWVRGAPRLPASGLSRWSWLLCQTGSSLDCLLLPACQAAHNCFHGHGEQLSETSRRKESIHPCSASF